MCTLLLPVEELLEAVGLVGEGEDAHEEEAEHDHEQQHAPQDPAHHGRVGHAVLPAVCRGYVGGYRRKSETVGERRRLLWRSSVECARNKGFLSFESTTAPLTGALRCLQPTRQDSLREKRWRYCSTPAHEPPDAHSAFQFSGVLFSLVSGRNRFQRWSVQYASMPLHVRACVRARVRAHVRTYACVHTRACRSSERT